MIANLRHRVTLQTPTITRTDRGAEVFGWANTATVYADVRTPGGQEQTLSSQLEIGTLTHAVTIRYRTGITPKMRLVWGTRVFEINAVLDTDNRLRLMTLACLETVGETTTAVTSVGSPIGLLLTLTHSS